VKVDFETLKSGFLLVFHRMTEAETSKAGGISEGIKSLLVYIEENPGKRITSIAAGIGKPAKTIERWIKELRKDGKIEFRGSKKTGGYYVMGK
jgi:predicted HTH transcriptional regulator